MNITKKNVPALLIILIIKRNKKLFFTIITNVCSDIPMEIKWEKIHQDILFKRKKYNYIRIGKKISN